MSVSAAGAQRVTQRAPASCQSCYKKKIRCDRLTPCSNCVQRGIANKCHKEEVILRGLLPGSGRKSSRARSARGVSVMERDRVSPSPSSSGIEVTSNPTLSHILLAHQFQNHQEPPPSSAQVPSSIASPPVPSPSTSSQPPSLSSDILGVHLHVMGLHSDLSFDRLKESQEELQSTPLDVVPAPPRNLLSLIPFAHSHGLIKASLKFHSWIHCTVHEPSFMAEHGAWISALVQGEGNIKGYDFIALYFALLAGAFHLFDFDTLNTLGFYSNDLPSLSRTYFDASVEALQLSKYMSRPTLPVLQAICVLPMIGHGLGESPFLTSLLHTGLGLAKTLGLHCLGPETEESSSQGRIAREMGRRIWLCLSVAESLTPSAWQPWALLYPSTRTAPPSNLEDCDLSINHFPVPRPLHVQTNVSYLIAIGRLGNIMRSFTSALNSTDIFEQRQTIASATDNCISLLLDFCPSLQPREGEEVSLSFDIRAPYDYGPWARYLWSVEIPFVRIVIWRSFLRHDFLSPHFSEARQICLASARAIMKVARRSVPPMFQKTWPMSSNTILAGMVLGTEYAHGSHDTETLTLLRQEVQEALAILERRRSLSALISRGITLLSDLIADREAAATVVPLLESLWPLSGINGEEMDDNWWSGWFDMEPSYDGTLLVNPVAGV